MKRCLAAIAAACLLLLAGCGGGTHPVQAVPGPTGHAGPARIVIDGHPCSPSNQVMQCVLPPAPVGVVRGAPPSTVSGIDFAWSCPSPVGHAFGASYLSGTTKDWTRACLALYHANHAATVFVRETSGTATLGGCAAGARDARDAAAELATDGAPAGQPFDMAIDFDATSSQMVVVGAYFHCALVAEPGRVNAYGGYDQVLYLFQHGDVGRLNWQTYAWSGGRWLPASIAPLEQYLNGSAVDYDRAIAANYGQRPYVAPAPPGPTPKQRTAAEKGRDASLRAYKANHCTKPVLGPANCHAFASRVVYFQEKTGQHPVCWGPHAQASAPVCQIVRSKLSVWSHARQATASAYQKHNCQGPANFGDGVHTPLCNELRQRQNYFTNRAPALFKEWK